MPVQMRFWVWWVVAFAAAVSALCGFWWGSAARLDPGLAVGAAAMLFMVVLVWLALRAEQAGEKHADVPDLARSVTDFPRRSLTGQVQGGVNTGPGAHRPDALFQLAGSGPGDSKPLIDSGGADGDLLAAGDGDLAAAGDGKADGDLPAAGDGKSDGDPLAENVPEAPAALQPRPELMSALAFLAQRTGLADEAGAREVAEELGCLPLGLAQATAVMARERLGYGAYLERLRALPVDKHLGRVEDDPYPRGVAEAVLLSGAGVEDSLGGLCGAVMDLVGVLSEAGVPRALLQAAGDSGVLTGSGGGYETGSGRVPSARMDAAIGRLEDASLLGLSVDGSMVSAHRLTMRVVRERRIADGKLAAVAAAAVTVLASLAGAAELVREDPAAVRDLVGQITALDEHVTGHLAGFGVDGTESLLRLRVRGMWLVNELDDSPGQVIELGVPLAADCERVLGADHPGTLAARFNLAYAYESAGRLDQAIPLYEQVLAGYERVLGGDHPDTLISRNNLAYAYESAGRLDEAIPLYEQVLARREWVLGAGPDTLAARFSLACVYESAGRLGDAIPLFTQSLADYERVFGADHPDTLTSRFSLACAYESAGRLGEAIPLFEQSLADYERVFGADHPDTLTSRDYLAYAYEVAEQGEAIALFERALAGRERVLGADHPDTLTSRLDLADAYESAGRLGEAIALHEQVLADCERVLGADHSVTLTIREHLAAAHGAHGATKH
jgi:tetratricopeptide (TPR) repeat protein